MLRYFMNHRYEYFMHYQDIFKLKNMRILAPLYLLLMFALSSNAQGISKNARLSLITCSPGSELYSIFGHSAIRLVDTTTQTDLIFNYGVFDFSTPHFYWKFIRGKLQYQLAIQRTSHFLQGYKRDGRWVKEEKFHLNPQEKRQMIDFLFWNYQPANRYYLYDFFYNNCSTKIWDVASSAVSRKMAFDTSIYRPQSFRNLLEPYLEREPWARLGIDLLLGMPADRLASFSQQMYLPDYLSRHMSYTYLSDPEKGKVMLLGSEQMLIEPNADKSELSESLIKPQLAGWMFFVVFLLISFVAGRKTKKWVDGIFLGLLGLLGMLMIFAWFATNHQQMDGNLNVLWANPLGLLFGWFVLRNQMQNAARLMAIWTGLSLLTLVSWHILPQNFNEALIPVILTIVVRGADRWLALKRNWQVGI